MHKMADEVQRAIQIPFPSIEQDIVNAIGLFKHTSV
jgi:aspartate/glutamate racemase